MAKNSQVSTYAGGLLKLSLEWPDASETPTSVTYSTLEYWRYDAWSTNNSGGNWTEYLNPDPNNGGHKSTYSGGFGSGSGWRKMDYWGSRTFQKGHSSYPVYFNVTTNSSFGTWNQNTGMFITVGSKSITKTFTIPAKWHSVVTFDANGGTGAPSGTLEKWYGETGPEIPADQQPTRSGFVFRGWSADQSAVSASFSPGDTYSVEPASAVENVTLYAVWQIANVSVKFYDDGGSGGPESTIATYGQPMKAISSLPTKTGYQFDGYYLNDVKYYNADGTSARTCDQTAAFTLTAHWIANTYYVQFNKNGGISGSMTNQTMTYDAPTSLKENEYIPPSDAYVFSGWSLTTNGDLLPETVENLTVENGATVVVYARWELSSPEANHFKNYSCTGMTFTWTMGSTGVNDASFLLKWTDRNGDSRSLLINELSDEDWEHIVDYSVQLTNVPNNSLVFKYGNSTRTVSLADISPANIRPYPSLNNNSWSDFVIECVYSSDGVTPYDSCSFGLFFGKINIGKPTITRNAKSMSIEYAAPSSAIRGYPGSVEFSYDIDGSPVNFSSIDENIVGMLNIHASWDVEGITPEQVDSTRDDEYIRMSSIRCPLSPTISSVSESGDIVLVVLQDNPGSCVSTGGEVILGSEQGTGYMNTPINVTYRDYSPITMRAYAIRNVDSLSAPGIGDYIYCSANGLYYRVINVVQVVYSVEQVSVEGNFAYLWSVDTVPQDNRIPRSTLSNSISVDVRCTSVATERYFMKTRERLIPTSVPQPYGETGEPATEVSFTPSEGGAPWLVDDDEYRYDYYLYLGGKQVGTLSHNDSETSFTGLELISPSETLLYIKTRDMDGNEVQSDSYVYSYSKPGVGIFVYRQDDDTDILIDNCLLEGMSTAVWCSADCSIDIIDTDISVADSENPRIYEIKSNGTVRESLNRWKR